MRSRIIRASSDAPPFDPAWKDTVFLVPDPPAAWPPVFAVVTAHDPGGHAATGDENARAQRALDLALEREGLPSFVVVGASPDRRHQESGRAVVTDRLEVAAGLAARFGQAGFFWIEDGQVFACVDATGRGWPIGAWRYRVVSTRP